jgi:hypothetical protein
MRDTVRFHFGFTVPLVAHARPEEALDALAREPGDLALVPAAGSARGAPWWSALEAPSAPKIIARLPFVERTDHPAGLPVFAIARPHPDAVVREVEVWSLRVSGWGAAPARALRPLCEAVVAHDSAFDGAVLLVSVPKGRCLSEIVAALVGAGASIRSRFLVGCHASRYMLAPGATMPSPTSR